jgi:hypothetical protein
MHPVLHVPSSHHFCAITCCLQLRCGTWQYWVLVLSPLLVMLLVWGVARHHILWKAAWKVKLDIQDAGDLKWDARTTTIYPAICEYTH